MSAEIVLVSNFVSSQSNISKLTFQTLLQAIPSLSVSAAKKQLIKTQ